MNTTKKKLYISCPMKGRTEEAIRHDMDLLARHLIAINSSYAGCLATLTI